MAESLLTNNNSVRSLKERIQEIKDLWFLTEPAYFMVSCTHQIEINNGIECGIACGGGYIYLNEKYFENKSDKFLEESLKIELIRILLKHPYQRQLPNRVKMYLASNFVIANNFKPVTIKMKTTREFFGDWKHDKSCLEEIYNDIDFPSMGQDGNQQSSSGGFSFGSGSGSKNNKGKNNQQGQNGDSDDNGDGNNGNGNDKLKNFDDCCQSTEDAFSRTQFWKEDDYRTVEINNIIDKIDSSNSWGTVPGNVVDVIKNSLAPKFNYKALFQQFRSSVLSSKYTKTRMRPSRRFGYEAMGSKRSNTTSLLVAVDTSGSISDDELELALGFIRGFFDYAVEKLDVVQFDTEIYKDSLISLTKKPKSWRIHGRGGTDFNDIFEFVQNKNKPYDGVLIITDGYASVPDKKYLAKNYGHVKYLWVLNNERNFERFKEEKEFAKFGKCTYVDRSSTGK